MVFRFGVNNWGLSHYLDEQDLSEKLKSELQWFELENKLLNLWEY
ncbi:surface protein (fragment) [Streptococcus pneumoniae]